MGIHQIQIEFIEEQDRLLLRMSDQTGREFKAWFTRRLAVSFLPLLDKFATEQVRVLSGPAIPVGGASPTRETLVEQFNKEAELRKVDFDTPYKSAPAQPLLGNPEDTPLLLTHAEFSPTPDNQLILKLSERLIGAATSRNIDLNLNAQLSNGMLQLIYNGAYAADWLKPGVSGASQSHNSLSDEEPMAVIAPPKRLLN